MPVPHQPPPLPAKTRRSNEKQIVGRQSLPASPAPTAHAIEPCRPSDASQTIMCVLYALVSRHSVKVWFYDE